MSHKVLRIGGPFCLVTLAVSSIVLAPAAALYAAACATQAALYVLAAGGAGNRRQNGIGRLMTAAFAFVMLNVATAVGIVRFMSGRQTVTWTKASEVAPPMVVP